MKLVIYGSRSLSPGYAEIQAAVVRHFGRMPDEVICGMARGADWAGRAWAEACNIPIRKFPADWDKYGRSAGHKRNYQMAVACTHGLGFWDGSSRGTANMTATLRALGKPTAVEVG